MEHDVVDVKTRQAIHRMSKAVRVVHDVYAKILRVWNSVARSAALDLCCHIANEGIPAHSFEGNREPLAEMLCMGQSDVVIC